MFARDKYHFCSKDWLFFLNIFAIIHPRSFVSYCHSTSSFISNLRKFHYGRPHVVKRIDHFSREKKKEEFISKKRRSLVSDPSLSNKRIVSHRREKEAASLSQPQKQIRQTSARSGPERYFSGYFHGAFPPGSAMLHREQAEEACANLWKSWIHIE